MYGRNVKFVLMFEFYDFIFNIIYGVFCMVFKVCCDIPCFQIVHVIEQHIFSKLRLFCIFFVFSDLILILFVIAYILAVKCVYEMCS